MITAAGIYDIPFAVYHSQPCDGPSMSSSDAIVLAAHTPAHLIVKREEDRAVARKADFGTVVHTLSLEPLRSASAIAVIDFDSYRKDAAKEAADIAMKAGKTPILTAEYDRAVKVAGLIPKHPDTLGLLDGKCEQTLAAKHESGIYMLCRPDCFTTKRIIVDIKTVSSASEEFLQRRVYGGWFQQAAWYCEVVKRVTGELPADYLWICIEQKPPHGIVVRRPSRIALEAGAKLNAEAIATYAECVRTKTWPDYPTGIKELGLPDYAHYRLEERFMEE